MWGHSPDSINLPALIAAFNEEHPDVTINYVQGGESKWEVMASGGVAPEVGRVNDDYMVDYALKGFAAPLDDYIEKMPVKGPDDYIPYFWEWPRVAGHHYGWIVGWTPRVLFVNKDMFAARGLAMPPKDWENPAWTWDTMLEAAKKLTTDKDADGNPDTFGVSLFHETGIEQTWSVNNGGPGIYSKNGRRFTLADPAGVQAMQYLADLANVWQVHPTRQQLNETSPASMFASGNLGMYFATARGTIDTLRRSVGDSFEWAVRPVPMKVRGIQEASLESFFVLKGSKYPDLGYEFVRFMSGEKAQAILARIGFSVGLKPQWAEKYFLQPDQMPLDQDVLISSFDHYRPVNKAVGVQEARKLYRPMLEKVYAGEVSAQEALTSVRGPVEKLLAAFPDANW